MILAQRRILARADRIDLGAGDLGLALAGRGLRLPERPAPQPRPPRRSAR